MLVRFDPAGGLPASCLDLVQAPVAAAGNLDEGVGALGAGGEFEVVADIVIADLDAVDGSGRITV